MQYDRSLVTQARPHSTGTEAAEDVCAEEHREGALASQAQPRQCRPTLSECAHSEGHRSGAKGMKFERMLFCLLACDLGRFSPFSDCLQTQKGGSNAFPAVLYKVV